MARSLSLEMDGTQCGEDSYLAVYYGTRSPVAGSEAPDSLYGQPQTIRLLRPENQFMSASGPKSSTGSTE